MKKEFTIASARERIAEQEGFIVSSGTHRLASLLASTHDVVKNIEGMEALTEEIARAIHIEPGENAELLDYQGKVHLGSTENEERVNYLWNETVYHAMNELAPKGYYFGSHAGNGSDIGFFLDEDGEE